MALAPGAAASASSAVAADSSASSAGAGVADGGGESKENLVIVSSRGGVIVPEKEVTIVLPKDDNLITEFRRKGNVYVMDAWVERDKVAVHGQGDELHAVESSFTRQAQP